MHFTRYRYIYLGVIVAIACTAFVLKGPLYEAMVDISVNPPEYIRKADFSWITVNEWFNSQIYIITSHAILKDAKTDFPEEKLKKIIRAVRLGAADIIRISARAEDRPEVLIKLVDEVSTSYLNKLYEPAAESKEALPPREKPVVVESKNIAKQEMYTKAMDVLYAERTRLKKEAREIDGRLRNYATDLQRLEALITEYRDVKAHIAQIDSELGPLNEKLERLRAVYTDNWPDVAAMKQRVDMLKEGRESLLAQADRLKIYEREKSALQTKIEVENSTNLELQTEMRSVDDRLAEAIKAMSGERQEKPESPKAENVPELKRGSYGYVINPPTINFLPDLGPQLIYGLLVGSIIWLLIGLILGKK